MPIAKEHLLSSSPIDRRPDAVPAPVAEMASVMSTFPAHWALCGGWAVDSWLGRISRDHGDVYISVFQDDQRALFDHLRHGWELIAHDPNVPDTTTDPWTGRWLDLPGHVHARPKGAGKPVSGTLNSPDDAGFRLDIQICDREGDEWLISRDLGIAIPVADCVRVSPWGTPTVVPEVLLAFKALERRPQDEQDFDALLPRLTKDQRGRLRNAIRTIDGAHPWLNALREKP